MGERGEGRGVGGARGPAAIVSLRDYGHGLENVGEDDESFAPKRCGSFGVFGLVCQFELAVCFGGPEEKGGGGSGEGYVEDEPEFQSKYRGAELNQDAGE
jgi:hypothetical protein